MRGENGGWFEDLPKKSQRVILRQPIKKTEINSASLGFEDMQADARRAPDKSNPAPWWQPIIIDGIGGREYAAVSLDRIVHTNGGSSDVRSNLKDAAAIEIANQQIEK